MAGTVLAYTGLKNVSVAQAIRGDTNSNPSSAGKLAGIAFQGSDTPSNETSPNPNEPLPAGVGRFDGKPVALWIIPLLAAARKTGIWKGKVTSGYRTKAEQTAIYNSGVRPAAKPGSSNHEGSVFPRGAVDVSDASGLARALKRVPGGNVLVWAGTKDPVHFSHPHNGSY